MLINILVDVPNPKSYRCPGIDSSIIFGVAHSSTPLANPNTTLPRLMTHQFLTIDRTELNIRTKLNMITLTRLPFVTKAPPKMEPRVTPTTELVEMKVSQLRSLLEAKNSGHDT
jgi:hypothetical protein